MVTYLILNLVFMAIVLAVLRPKIRRPTKAWWLTLGGLLILTLIFDNVMIYFDLFTYNSDHLLGIFIGLAPIEDFFYAVFAAILIPTLWSTLKSTNA